MNSRRSPFHRYAVPLGVMVLCLACEEPQPTDPIGESTPEALRALEGHAHGSQERPFRLRGKARLVSQSFAPGFGPPTFGRSDFGGRCSTQADFVIAFDVVGQATHLGRFTASAENCSVIDSQTGMSAAQDGIMTFTAANGDELWDRYEGAPEGVDADEIHRFVGGTGRFSPAVGEAAGHVECDRAAGTCVITLDGHIGY